MSAARPPRTSGHAQRDALIARFAAAGLVPVLSTNGSVPDADIQVSYDKTTRPGGDVVRADLTQHGQQRWDAAR
jgi:hypothetical protein